MKHRLIVRSKAKKDLTKAFLFYEKQLENLGEKFIRCVDVGMELILNHPESPPRYHGNIRRYLVSVFPFGIFYIVEPKRIVILAILDLRQNPQKIKKRLGILIS